MAGLALVPLYGTGSGFIVGAITQHSSGYWDATFPGSRVVSVDPAGGVDSRDPGTFGPNEQAGGQNNEAAPDGTVYPAVMVYCCGAGQPVYAFRVTTVVPNI